MSTLAPDLSSALLADPTAFRPDPHAGFRHYRPRAGVIRIAEDGMPLVTRHADVATLLADPRSRNMETTPLQMRGVTSGALFDFYAHSMLLANAPRHAQRRGPTARAFAHRVIESWRPHIRRIVIDLLDEFEGADDVDFLADLASPLPSRLIAHIIGAPDEDAPSFARNVYALARGLGAFPAHELPGIERGARELCVYVSDLLEDRRRSPQDDFLSNYLARVDEAGHLSPIETLMQIVTIIIAGSDTTRFALTMTLSLLLKHRSQWIALVADPDLAPKAVLEGVRFEPPVGATGRVAAAPIEVDGVTIATGSPFRLSLVSAQRDERVFAEPDRFNIRRGDHPRWSASFGHGAHRCLGEALARAELEEALRILAVRYPEMTLAGLPATAIGHGGLRGITPLRVRLGRRH